jgi:hypothetical protein
MHRPNRFLGSLGSRLGGFATIGYQHAPALQRLRFGPLASLPAGYGMRAVIPPWTAGSIRTTTTLVTLSATAVGALGRNIEAAAAIQIVADATGGLITGGTATATVTLVGSADVIGALNGEAACTVTITALADASALGFAAAAAAVTITAEGQPMGKGFMVATTAEAGLTPAGIARAVWEALAAASDVPGTMGEKLNAAGSAANPWTDPDGIAVLERLTEIWRLHGLKPGEPMTVTPTTRVAGDLEQTIEGDPQVAVTVARV